MIATWIADTYIVTGGQLKLLWSRRFYFEKIMKHFKIVSDTGQQKYMKVMKETAVNFKNLFIY